jgi:hypothetical protein
MSGNPIISPNWSTSTDDIESALKSVREQMEREAGLPPRRPRIVASEATIKWLREKGLLPAEGVDCGIEVVRSIGLSDITA